MSLRRFRAPALPMAGGPVRLDPKTSHHLLRVTGVAPGEAVELFDGGGLSALARLDGVEEGVALLQAEPATVGEAGPERWLLVGLLKGPAFDLALRMATELGVHQVVPLLSERAVATGDRHDRWARIVDAAVAQCGRARGPELHPPLRLDEALDLVPDEVPLFVALPDAPDAPPVGPGPAAVLVGPEGGFSPAEVDRCLARGARPLRLGRWVLRADTAVVAALARLG